MDNMLFFTTFLISTFFCNTLVARYHPHNRHHRYHLLQHVRDETDRRIRGRSSGDSEVDKLTKEAPATKAVKKLVEQMEDDMKELITTRKRIIEEPLEAIVFQSQKTNMNDKEEIHKEISKGVNYFVKVKAKVKKDKKEETEYFHFRIFTPESKDEEDPLLIGIDGKIVDGDNVANVKKLKDSIKPIGIFDNWEGVQDPLNITRVQFFNPNLQAGDAGEGGDGAEEDGDGAAEGGDGSDEDEDGADEDEDGADEGGDDAEDVDDVESDSVGDSSKDEVSEGDEEGEDVDKEPTKTASPDDD